MCVKIVHNDNLGFCLYCDHLFEKRYPYYWCALKKQCFGKVEKQEDCDCFKPIPDEDNNENN